MTLYLHIGHGKTGSSAIQSFLALNVARLAEFGVWYPEHPSFAQARGGMISSGNLNNRADWHDQLRHLMAVAPPLPDQLFSSEGIFRYFVEDPAPMQQLASEHDLAVLVFLRDPLEHAHSAWGQNVKRHGYQAGFETYCAGFDGLAQTRRCLDQLAQLDIRFHAVNYGCHRTRIEACFADMLLGDRGDAFFTGAERLERLVNRSLGEEELDLMRLVNAALPEKQAAQVADALVNKLPDTTAAAPVLSTDGWASFEDRMRPDLMAVNRFLAPKETLRLVKPALPDPGAADAITLSRDQLRLLLGALVSGAQPAARLPQEPFRALVRTVQRGLTGHPPRLEDARQLLNLAQQGRSGAPKLDALLKALNDTA